MSLLWTDKYFPGSLEEFIGNHELVESVKEWVNEWEQGRKPKPLLLFGQTGAGKTCLVHLIARLNNWQLFELNASDFRTKDIIEKVAGGAALNASFFGGLRLVLLDEVDGLQGVKDKGGAAAIAGVLKEAEQPIILTANDIYSNPRMAVLRNYCTKLEFKKINYLSMAKRLKEIAVIEKLEFEEDAVKELAKRSAGDFRSALLDLQTLSNEKISLNSLDSLGYRERQENVFKILSKIFHSRTVDDSRQALASTGLSLDLLKLWVEENIPRYFNKGVDASNAFERLSRADVFDGRIFRRQHFGFLKYSSSLMTAGVALQRKNHYPGFFMFQFPRILSSLSKSSSQRRMKKELCKKIGKQIHSSSKRVMSEDLPFIELLFQGKEFAQRFSAQFDLSVEEIAFLMNSSPKTKKVQNLFEESQKTRLNALKPKIVSEKELKEIEADRQQSSLKAFFSA